jgi:rhamnulokinase
MAARVFAAIDLGASGGRVIAGVVDGARVTLHPVHRFPNGAQESGGHLRWDFTGLFEQVLVGLTQLARDFPGVESIGIDTWGVDYGLLDGDGCLLAEPVSYRDERTTKSVDDVHAIIGPGDLFALNGLQVLPFNTVYQLAAERSGSLWSRARHVVLLPDLVAYWLTGELRTEATNASTTGLLDVRTGQWSDAVLDRLDLPRAVLPPIENAGMVRGSLRPAVRARTGLPASTVVTTVGSHDTASAVAGVPAATERFAYVASGTWSLVGLELEAPIVTDDARAANFTNERGVDGRIRFLRNVGGLWLLQESLRTWAARGEHHDLSSLLTDTQTLPAGGLVIDVDDPVFLAPGDMPARIASACGASGSLGPAQLVRCVIDSLARSYAATVQRAAELAARRVDVVHIVGGGSQNELLCQMTADAARLPVVAGPVEATALGNVLVQARARGAAPSALEALRSLNARSSSLRRYMPT